MVEQNQGISNSMGVILMVVIVVIVAGLIGFLAFFMGSDLHSSSSAAITLDNGKVKVIDMGNSQYLILKDGNQELRLNSTGSSLTVNGGEQVLSVTDNGDRSVLKTITEEQVRESGGTVYVDPPRELDPENFTVSSGDEYGINDDRIAGTYEKFEVKFDKKYNPKAFTYSWSSKYSSYNNHWRADINKKKNGKKAIYNYHLNSPTRDGTGTASYPILTITNKKTSDSIKLAFNEGKRYSVRKPIKSVEFNSREDHYSGGDDRLPDTNEKWEVTEIKLHEELYNLSQITPPEKLSKYNWLGWSSEYSSYNNQWRADIDENKEVADYHYTLNAPTRDGTGTASRPIVSIQVPGLEPIAQSFTPEINKYSIRLPIKSVEFNSREDHYSGGDDRLPDTNETWEVTKITLHPKVEEVPEASKPSNLSGYEWVSWSSEYSSYNNQWRADIDENKEVADYHYTLNAPTRDGTGTASRPIVTISVPGITPEQSFTPEIDKYSIRLPIRGVSFSSGNSYSGDEDRVAYTNETWEVTKITLHPKVEEVPEASKPSNLSGYDWIDWSSEYSSYNNQWRADIDENKEVAVYNYTLNAPTRDGTGTASRPIVSISVPGIDPIQSFVPDINKYSVVQP